MHCIIFDIRGNPWGPFPNTKAAMDFVKQKWPGQEQDENNYGARDDINHTGWNIAALYPPDL